MTGQLVKLQIGDFVDFIDRELCGGGRSTNMEVTDQARWFCITVRPGCHNRVELELSRLGFRSFYPKARKWASHARTKKAVERPILNRYVFVEVDHPRQSFSTVSEIHDVECLISSLGRPTPFPAHWVEGLLTRYMQGEWDEIAHGKIPVGARIRIVEGEFDKAFGTVVSVKGSRVDIKPLGKKNTVRINECSVRAA